MTVLLTCAATSFSYSLIVDAGGLGGFTSSTASSSLVRVGLTEKRLPRCLTDISSAAAAPASSSSFSSQGSGAAFSTDISGTGLMNFKYLFPYSVPETTPFSSAYVYPL